MSHFDTISFFKFIIKFAVIIAFGFSSKSYANYKCELLFKPTSLEKLKNSLTLLNPMQLFSQKNQAELSAAQITELNEYLKSDLNIKPFGYTRGTEEPFFMYIWSSIPQSKKNAIIYLMQYSPQEFKKFRGFILEIFLKYQIEDTTNASFFETLLTNWGEHLRNSVSPQSFETWIGELHQNYIQRLNSGELKIEDLKNKLERGQQYRMASQYWQSQAGVYELPTRSENGQDFVLLNGHWLKSQISRDKKTIRILVQREMVGRAAWNPIYTNVLLEKAASGLRKLSHYPAFIATNGVCYLSDGNHRFILDDRPEVWLELGYPAKTSSMSISFDAIGIQQPSIENLVKLQNGEITLVELIGAVNFSKIIYR